MLLQASFIAARSGHPLLRHMRSTMLWAVARSRFVAGKSLSLVLNILRPPLLVLQAWCF